MTCNILCGSFPHYLVLVWHCEWATLSVPSGFPRLAGHCSQRMRSAGPSLQDSSSFHSFWGHGTKRGGEKERETEARAFLITDCTVMRKARANKLKIRYWHIKTLAQKTKHKVHHALTVWSHNYQYILIIIDSNKQNLKSQFKKTNQTITFFLTIQKTKSHSLYSKSLRLKYCEHRRIFTLSVTITWTMASISWLLDTTFTFKNQRQWKGGGERSLKAGNGHKMSNAPSIRTRQRVTRVTSAE